MKKINKNFIKKNRVVILFFILIILTILIILVNIFSDNKISDKKINTLYSYISNDDIEKCGGLQFYQKDKVTTNTLSDDVKMCIAFIKTDNLKSDKKTYNRDSKKKTCTTKDKMVFATDNYEEEKCTVNTYDIKEVKNTYKKIFGTELKELDSFNLDDYNICYIKDNTLYCGLSEIFSFTIGNQSYVYRTLKKTVEKGDQIIIYDYFIKVNEDKCYSSFDGSEIKKCSKNLKKNNKVNYKFIKKYGSTYKHTFKKVNNNDYYSWVESEKVD